MTPIEAVRKLTDLNYRFELAGDRLRYRYEGHGKPDPDTVRPLLEAVKANKPEVVDFLRCYCPNGKINDDESAGRKSISICPKYQGEIFLKTSFGKKYCYQCLTELNGAIFNGICSIGLNEVDWILEEAVEKAEERSAILEHDGGLGREQADKTARGLHIQPAIEELVRRGLIVFEGEAPEAQMTAIPPAKVAKVAKHYFREASPPERPVTCAAACHWYASNPWSHDPTLLGWCYPRMEPLEAGSPACEEFCRGEVPPPRQNPERVPQVQPSTSPAPQEHVLTCYECHRFEANHGPNPRQGWGKCLKRGRGRFGCATACDNKLQSIGNL